MIIGGHEDKDGNELILRDLLRRIGNGKLVVATVASKDPDEIWTDYERTLRRLGVKHLHHLDIETREDACAARKLKVLDDAAGVFFSGGDQLKITMLLGGTPVARRVEEIYEQGGVVAGTSAGASMMCDTMIVGSSGDDVSARVGRTVRMSPGLGLIKNVLIDQHFAERGRIPRLLGAIAQNPCILGIGIDENTAIVVDRRGRRFRVIGDGAVYLFDARRMSYANLAEEETDRTLSVFDVRMDMLSQGDSYDLATRRPAQGRAEDVEKEIDEEAAA